MTEANPGIIIAPSILAADYGAFAGEARRAADSGGDWLHVDVMDGHFVDNISFGTGVLEALDDAVDLYLDVHLMITRPDRYWARFAEAGAGGITVHAEADHDVGETLRQIRAAGCRPGLAINPATPFTAAEPYLEMIDLFLVMTVEPGLGGQAFMPETLPKVTAAKQERFRRGLSYDVEVDGGIDGETAPVAADAGANVLVAGTSLFKAPVMAEAIEAMRQGVSTPR